MDNRQSRPRLAHFKCSAVISDVDGTLVADDKVLTAHTKAAVAELSASGIVFSIISSRPPRGLHKLVEHLGITTPVGGFNGGVITTPDLAVVSQHLLLPQIAQDAVHRLDARGIQVWVFSGQDWLVRDPDGPYVPLEECTIGFPPTIVEDFGSALETVAKIVGVSKNFDVLERCEHNVRAALDDGAFVARSQPYYLDITHPLANKDIALTEIAKLLDIPFGEIAVIGDGSNDVAMFKRSGLSIAMGNASPEVQAQADLVTECSADDGFAKAIERFILPRRNSVERAQSPKKISPRSSAHSV
jgi:Cof subfamily protein (haloacid dehalogenase superfamily)